MIWKRSSIAGCCAASSARKRRSDRMGNYFLNPHGTSFVTFPCVIPFLQKVGAWYDGQATEFLIWAPLRDRVELLVSTPEETVHSMQKDDAGYWQITLPVSPGTRYGYRLDGKTDLT